MFSDSDEDKYKRALHQQRYDAIQNKLKATPLDELEVQLVEMKSGIEEIDIALGQYAGDPFPVDEMKTESHERQAEISKLLSDKMLLTFKSIGLKTHIKSRKTTLRSV